MMTRVIIFVLIQGLGLCYHIYEIADSNGHDMKGISIIFIQKWLKNQLITKSSVTSYGLSLYSVTVKFRATWIQKCTFYYTFTTKETHFPCGKLNASKNTRLSIIFGKCLNNDILEQKSLTIFQNPTFSDLNLTIYSVDIAYSGKYCIYDKFTIMDKDKISHHCGHLPPWTIISSNEKLILITRIMQKSERYKLLLGFQLMKRNGMVHRPDNVKLCRTIRLLTFHDKCSLNADPVKRRMYLFFSHLHTW